MQKDSQNANPDITIKINEIKEKKSQFAKKWHRANHDIPIKT
ncbi:hypothetical protein BGP_0399 [Beggiatoa sp. PS]|nr:hypothetical protein BGP_0399 [Beggiatoa sp. PS]